MDRPSATPTSDPPPQRQRQQRPREGQSNVLLGVTGSVAAVKAPELAVRLARHCDVAQVRIVLTRGGSHFFHAAADYDPVAWNALQEEVRVTKDRIDMVESNSSSVAFGKTAASAPETTETPPQPRIRVYENDEEWRSWERLGDPVLHIALRDWADILVVAPLSAHTLAKFAHGYCDDTLSSIMRAWEFGQTDDEEAVNPHQIGHDDDGARRAYPRRRRKPIILAPAMNTAMWNHPLTSQQLHTIQHFWPSSPSATTTANHMPGGHVSLPTLDEPPQPMESGVIIVPPQVKLLACGDIGNGAMASVETIVEKVVNALSSWNNVEA